MKRSLEDHTMSAVRNRMPLMYLEIHAMSELLHWSLSTLGDHLGGIIVSILSIFVTGWLLFWVYLGLLGRGGSDYD